MGATHNIHDTRSRQENIFMKQPIQHVSHFHRLSQHFVDALNTTDVALTLIQSILVTLALL